MAKWTHGAVAGEGVVGAGSGRGGTWGWRPRLEVGRQPPLDLGATATAGAGATAAAGGGGGGRDGRWRTARRVSF